MSNKLQFSTNEYVVYPAHGVGQIVSVEEQEIAGASLELYVIVFEKDKMTLRVPTNKAEEIGMTNYEFKSLDQFDDLEVLGNLQNALDSGISKDEAESEAQVTALISSLFLTHRGYAEVSQDSDGNISLKNLHLDDDNFSTLTNRINPKSDIPGGLLFNE